MEEIKIQIRFSINDFNDALYFSQTEYENTSREQIESLKQERYNNWLAFVENPEPVKEVNKTEARVEIVGIDEQIKELTERKEKLSEIIDKKEINIEESWQISPSE